MHQVLSKIFVSFITLEEQTYMCQKLGTVKHCCQVFQFFLMLCWTYHMENVRPCSALSCLCKRSGKPCQLQLEYEADFENCFFSKQLDGVKKVMATDEYGIFATDVREAELDSMEKLGLKVPYLKKWAQEQATLNYAAKGSTAEPDKPATKRLRLGSGEVHAQLDQLWHRSEGSMLHMQTQ
ncbi:TPA: hypothetical protein ACH3X1_003902 [Trebouxia sp. C0004]